jgi:hypothetical protein
VRARFICWLIGHDFFLIKRLTSWSRKIGCRRCGRCFGMNDDARAVIPWDYELEETYQMMGVDTGSQPSPTTCKHALEGITPLRCAAGCRHSTHLQGAQTNE